MSSVKEYIVFATFGLRDQLKWYIYGSDHVESIMTIPRDSFITALHISSDLDQIILGTDRGFLFHLSGLRSQSVRESIKIKKFFHGSSIQSVCFKDLKRIIFSDNQNRCFTKSIDEWNTKPVQFQTENKNIFSLIQVPQSEIIGLTACGQLVVWNDKDSVSESEYSLPQPISKSHQSRVIYWQKAQAIVYPGMTDLVLFRLDIEQVQSIPIPDGSYYTICPFNKYLLSVGYLDGVMKVYSIDDMEIINQHILPKGTISIHSSESQQILYLLNSAGEILIYHFDGDLLDYYKKIDRIRCYKVTNPDSHVIQKLNEFNRRKQAQTIINNIQSLAGKLPLAQLNQYFTQLGELGYEHVSLALQAKSAKEQKNILEELSIRQKQITLLPINHPKIHKSVKRYIAILRQLGFYKKANSVLALFHIKDEKIERRMNHRITVKVDFSLTDLLRAADILEEPLSGWRPIEVQHPTVWNIPMLQASHIVEKYHKDRDSCTNYIELLHSAHVIEIDWNPSKSSIISQSVVIPVHQFNPSIVLNLLLIVIPGPFHSQTIQVLTFQLSDFKENKSYKEYNETVLAIFKKIQNKDQDLYQPVFFLQEFITQALQKIENKVKANMLFES